MSLRILTVVGARPQFIKAAAVSRVVRDKYQGKVEETLVHTGQHYDENMSKVFFDDLGIPAPAYNLEIAGGNHGAMTGRMLVAIEEVLLKEKPDAVLIYGDTNSTLAGALAASKLHIPVAHVEAGLRSFNMRMPEEINRIVSDRVSKWLFCPTSTAVKNLKNEGITEGVSNIGDVMYDVALYYRDVAKSRSTILESLGLQDLGFILATCHRAENTDDSAKLKEIVTALAKLSVDLPVVFPVHPRTRKLLSDYNLDSHLQNLTMVEPLSFLDMVALEQAAKLILTDSGGVQKEAFFYGVPCVTMRDETEWVETVELGLNCLTGASAEKIVTAAKRYFNGHTVSIDIKPYGDGNAAEKIVAALI